MTSIDWSNATLLLVNATQGLALGMSVVVLADVIPWGPLRRHVWLTSGLLVLLWSPFVLSGIPPLRRVGNALVSLYLCWLFLAYAKYEKERERERKERHEAGCRQSRRLSSA